MSLNLSCKTEKLGHEAKQLTDEEIHKLLNSDVVLSTFKQQKLEKDAKKNWDLFYKRNLNKFFKDRHWTTREFQELLQIENVDDDISEQKYSKNLLEVGCGVGNFIWPLIKNGLNFNYFACDFSPVAVELFQKHELYNENLCQVFVADVSEPNGIKSKLKQNVRFHVVSLIFVLSAIHPEKMLTTLKNIHEILDSDGILIFRDYGLYDHAMLRFTSENKLADNFYVRQDGTRAYYFSREFMQNLLTKSGFDIIDLEYVKRETVNHKESLTAIRIFIQGKCRKHKQD